MQFDVVEAYRLRCEGLPDREIAKRLKVSKDTINRRLRDYKPPVESHPAAPPKSPTVWTLSEDRAKAVLAEMERQQRQITNRTFRKPVEPPVSMPKAVKTTAPRPVAPAQPESQQPPIQATSDSVEFTDRPPKPFVREETPEDIKLRLEIALEHKRRLKGDESPRPVEEIDPSKQNPVHHASCFCFDCLALRRSGWLQQDHVWVRSEDVLKSNRFDKPF